MSACLIIQQKNNIYIGSDSAISVEQNNQLYRLNTEGKKLYNIDNKIIFCSGELRLAYLIMNAFIQSENRNIDKLKNIACYFCNKRLNGNIEIIACEVSEDHSTLYQISSYNNFEIIDYQIYNDDTIIWTAGIKTEECYNNAYKYIKEKKSIYEIFQNTFDAISFEGVGGILSVYQLTNNKTKMLYEGQIKEKYIKYYKIKNIKTQHLIIAKKLIGELLVGQKLIINNEDGTVQVLGDGIIVKTPQGQQRVKLGKLDNGNYGISIYNSKGDVILSEQGIAQTNNIVFADNLDSDCPLRFKFFIDTEVLSVRNARLSFTLEKYRAYDKDVASGGGNTTTSENSSETSTAGGGYQDGSVYDNSTLEPTWTNTVISTQNVYPADFGTDGQTHQHDISKSELKHTHMFGIVLPNHTHNITHYHSVKIPSHTHSQVYGIVETTLPKDVKINIYKDDVLVNSGTTIYNSNQTGIELKDYIQSSGLYTIEMTTTRNGRINLNLFLKYFISM